LFEITKTRQQRMVGYLVVSWPKLFSRGSGSSWCCGVDQTMADHRTLMQR